MKTVIRDGELVNETRAAEYVTREQIEALAKKAKAIDDGVQVYGEYHNGHIHFIFTSEFSKADFFRKHGNEYNTEVIHTTEYGLEIVYRTNKDL